MARQISVSDDVYKMLLKKKDGKSFSATIRTVFDEGKDRENIMKYFGIMKSQRKELEAFKKQIMEDRKRNFGREFR